MYILSKCATRIAGRVVTIGFMFIVVIIQVENRDNDVNNVESTKENVRTDNGNYVDGYQAW